MIRKSHLTAFMAALLVFSVATTAYAALTFSSTTITSDSSLTLTTAAGNGVLFNSATSTDSMYIGGVAQFTAATASATSVVIGADVSLFRSAANTLTVQGRLATISLANGETIGNATDNNIFVNATSVSLATSTATTTRSVFISAPAGTATTTLSLGGKEGSIGNCIEMYREGNSYRMFLTASSGMQTVAGIGLKVEAGSCRD